MPRGIPARKLRLLRIKALRGTISAIRRYGVLLISIVMPKKEVIKAGVQTTLVGGATVFPMAAINEHATLAAILPLFYDAVKTGERRMVNVTAEPLELPDFIDQGSIAEIGNHQLHYIQNLQTAQQEKFADILINGQNKGWGLPQVSDVAVKEIQGLTRTRAELIAKSEVIKAHSVGMKATLKYNGFDEYRWSARPLTAPTPACATCRALDETMFKVGGPPPPFRFDATDPGLREKIKTASVMGYSVMPVEHTHPRCTCVLITG